VATRGDAVVIEAEPEAGTRGSPPRRARLLDGSTAADRRVLAEAGGDSVPVVRSARAGGRANESEPFEDDPSESEETGEPAVLPIVLNRLAREPGQPGIALSGMDPFGPRDLVAWRIQDGKAAVIARGSSDRDGEIAFPELVAPREGLEIVVTAADGTPGGPGASTARLSNARRPSTPNALMLHAEGGDLAMRIIPSEATGEILLAGADGQVFAQYRVPASPLVSSRMLDVTLELLPEDSHVLIGHVFADGRQSDWREIALEAQRGE
jgi:hypothetical protein